MLTQISELLAESRVTYSQQGVLEALVSELTEMLLKLPDKLVPAAAGGSFVRGLGAQAQVRLPVVTNVQDSYLQRQSASNIHGCSFVLQKPLNFAAPEAIDINGSYKSRVVAKPELVVDIATRMPGCCFADRDQLNNQYIARCVSASISAVCRMLICCSLKPNTSAGGPSI